MREFLQGLDLDGETIDSIMAEHGKLITKDKEKIQKLENELTSTKDSLDKVNKEISKLAEGESIDDLKKKIKNFDKEKEDAIKEANKNFEIKLALQDQVHNVDIVMSQLNLDQVVIDEKTGKVKSGLNEQLSDLKKTDSYLFKTEANNNNGGSNPNIVIKGATPKDGEGGEPSNLSKAELFAKNLAKSTNEANSAANDNVYFK